MHFWNSLHLLVFASYTLAQIPPPPKGVTTLKCPSQGGASLSYKQTFICETTPGVKAYSGYVNLPSTVTGETFNISTFYWYFSARKSPSTAPLAIYLAGGPGESSLDAAAGEGGPCNINPDSNSTTLNPWSWNRDVNMLYIDQPVQTGFSYDTLINGTLDLLSGTITPYTDLTGVKGNATTLLGTFPSQDPSSVTLGSQRGASALWHFMQVFVESFPHGNVKDKKISMWGNSWGGFFVPTTFAHFARQNERIIAKKISDRILKMDTMGTTNACIDPIIEGPLYPEMATKNTYGFKAYNESVYEAALSEFSMPGGCKDLILQCRQLAKSGDPDYLGTNQAVNQACLGAFLDCFTNVQAPYSLSGRSPFDISHPVLDPFPTYRAAGYFNQGWVQSALGVPLNFTELSSVVSQVYVIQVADAVRNDISNLEYVLSKGLQVVIVHGDRDYRCNWLGAEAVSLAAKWSSAADFQKAGYAYIQTNASYNGGFVRQAGRLSFSRVFQAGHAVQAFQPETVSRIFSRSMAGLDVSTGNRRVIDSNLPYRTIGPKTVRNATDVLPPMPESVCYTLQAGSSCTATQLQALADGSAIIKDFVVQSPGPGQ